MNSATLVALALQLLQSVVDEAVKSDVPREIIQDVEAAIASLVKTSGSDVTFGQLEQLRVKKIF